MSERPCILNPWPFLAPEIDGIIPNDVSFQIASILHSTGLEHVWFNTNSVAEMLSKTTLGDYLISGNVGNAKNIQAFATREVCNWVESHRFVLKH